MQRIFCKANFEKFSSKVRSTFIEQESVNTHFKEGKVAHIGQMPPPRGQSDSPGSNNSEISYEQPF